MMRGLLGGDVTSMRSCPLRIHPHSHPIPSLFPMARNERRFPAKPPTIMPRPRLHGYEPVPPPIPSMKRPHANACNARIMRIHACQEPNPPRNEKHAPCGACARLIISCGLRTSCEQCGHQRNGVVGDMDKYARPDGLASHA